MVTPPLVYSETSTITTVTEIDFRRHFDKQPATFVRINVNLDCEMYVWYDGAAGYEQFNEGLPGNVAGTFKDEYIRKVKIVPTSTTTLKVYALRSEPSYQAIESQPSSNVRDRHLVQ